MLEYFSYKKYKKYRGGKEADEDRKTEKKEQAKAESQSSSQANKGDSNSQHSSSADRAHAKTVLHPEDEQFLEELLSRHDDEDDEVPPPLPPRVYDFEYDSHSDNGGGTSENEATKEPQSKAADNIDQADKGKGDKNDQTAKKQGRLSIFFSKSKKPEDDGLKPDNGVAPVEAEREKKDISRVLARLNLSAMNNTVVSYSKDSSELLQKFTQVFKDIVNGAPTAYDDLTKLIEDRDGSISKLFDKLPLSLKKLVTQLPEKLTSTLAPELLAAAAEVQGIKAAEGGIKEGMKDSAKRLLKPTNLTDLVKKPGAVIAMLKAIVNVLKTRWPAFIGMNVIWSVALSLLLVVLWYCYKRGREERLDREKAETDSHRIEELPDGQSTPTITTT